MSTNLELQDKIDSVKAARMQRREDSAEAYLKLVRDSCNGIELDPESAAIVLEDADKSPDDLERDSQVYEHRVELANLLNVDRDATRITDECDLEIRRLIGERNEVCQRLNQQIDELVRRKSDAMNSVAVSAQAKAELRQTAWPHLKKAVEAIRFEMRGRGESRQELQLTIQTERANLRRHENLRDFDEQGTRRNRSAAFVTPEVKKHSALAAIETQKRLDQLLATEQRLADESEELLRQIAAIETEMLIP